MRAVAGSQGAGGGLGGRPGMMNLQVNVDQAAGGEAQTLSNKVEVVVVDPDRCEVIRHAKRNGVLGRFEANDGFKPHLEDILRE
jgi:hypothetical protein